MSARLITTAEAARRLGRTPRLVRWAIGRGHIPAKRIGRDWLIDEREIAYYELRHLDERQDRSKSENA